MRNIEKFHWTRCFKQHFTHISVAQQVQEFDNGTFDSDY